MNRIADFDKSKIEAEKLLSKYRIQDPSLEIFSTVESEGLSLRFVKMTGEIQGVAGFLDNITKTIFVNDDEPVNRQTFTIAHELGHFVLHHKDSEYEVLLRNPNGEKTPAEQEANCFAANFLVPELMLKKTMKEKGLGEDDTQALALLFGVSQEVIKNRLRQLSYNG